MSFGPFRLAPAERRLERDGVVVRLGSRALDLLIALAEHPGEVVGKETLLARAWPDLTVDESSLRFHIVGLRKALGLDATGQPFVINVPGRGYCLVAPVHPGPPSAPASSPAMAAATARGLPQPLDRIVGRESAVEHIHACLARHRFVSIHGAGGVGKTTVAVAVAHRHLEAVVEPVVFVDLATISEPTLVASTIASMLGVVAQSDDATPQVIDYLRDQRLLLVLDCCEHVIETVAGLLEQIYLEAPRVTLLVTSRERLRVEGEYVVPLAPLDFIPIDTGASAAQLLAPPAAQLLLQRIAAAGYGRDIREDDADVVAEICQRLDGNALAIELVASRVASHGLRDTALLLGGRLQLLWPGRRTASPRHQTLQSALDWSHDLLSDLSRRVFRRLSVFGGPFDLDCALDVAADIAECDAVVAALDDLVAKSLLSVRQESHGSRYRLLDLPRSYARHKLDESGEAAATAARHATAMLTALSRRPPATDGDRRRAHARTLLGDLHRALFWSFGRDGDRAIAVPLAAAACEVFTELSLLNEGVRWSQRALEVLGNGVDPIGAAVVLHATLGNALMFTEGNDDLARAALERALALAEEMGDRENQFRLLTRLHMCQRRRGEIAELLPTSERLMQLARQIGTPVAIAAAHTQFAVAHHLVGDQPAARGHIEIAQHLDLFRSVAPDHFAFHRNPSLALARCLWLQGAPDAALAMARPLIEEAAASDAVTQCITLIWAAAVFRWAGDHDTVQRVADRLSAHARSHSLRPYQAVGQALQGEGLVGAGQTSVGLALLRSAVASLQAARYELYTPGFEATIARALAAQDDIAGAAALLDGTLARVSADGETCELPDLLRLRAALCLRLGRSDETDARLAAAMTVARRQGALAWQLRIAADQVRVARRAGPATEAAATLAAIYRRFQDGFATADLVAARALLAENGVAVDPVP